MKKRNIYQNQSQELLNLFEQAADNAKVMCVPIDYAKKDHVVMFCNGYGDILRKPFSVKNSPQGVEYLTDQVMRSCRQRAISQKHVFFGGEDVDSANVNQPGGIRARFPGTRCPRSGVNATDCMVDAGMVSIFLEETENREKSEIRSTISETILKVQNSNVLNCSHG